MGDREAATRTAIECMTLWLEGDNDESRLPNALHIAGLINDPDGPRPADLVTGLLNLNLHVLLDLMRVQGADASNDIDQAREYLQRLSLRLGE